MKYLICILLTLTISAGCEPEYPAQEDLSPVTFSLMYTNLAWGFQHQVWLFDHEGRIYTYNTLVRDSSISWRTADPSTGLIAAEDLIHNRANATPTGIQVTADWSHWLRDAQAAADGRLTVPRQTAYDSGSWRWVAYVRDTRSGLFREVLLLEDGDFSSENTSAAARRLVRRINRYR